MVTISTTDDLNSDWIKHVNPESTKQDREACQPQVEQNLSHLDDPKEPLTENAPAS